MNGERHFLDTNVLVCANDQSDPQRRSVAATLVADGIRNRRGVVSSQVLSEFWVTITRKVQTPLPFELAEAELLRLRSMLVVAVEYDTVVLAVHLQRKHGVSYWDALILASAHAAHCAVVYSEDLNNGQRYGDVLVENPFR
jgi:predicted nucleic acid-binding protein